METPQTISHWATTVFGQDASLAVMAARVNCEVAELHLEIAKGNQSRVAVEAADVYITLCHMAAVVQKYVEDLDVLERISDVVPSKDQQILLHTMHMVNASKNSSGRASLLASMFAIIADLKCLSSGFIFSLGEAVDTKMRINRSRDWRVEQGVGQHA